MKLIMIALMLTVLTGWSLDDTLQDIGSGVRTGVSNTEEGSKEAPGVISEAGNQADDDIKKEDAEKKDNSKSD